MKPPSTSLAPAAWLGRCALSPPVPSHPPQGGWLGSQRRTGASLGEPRPPLMSDLELQSPSRHDVVTMCCAVCGSTFRPTGRQRYCSGACRAAAYRARRDSVQLIVKVPKAQPRRPITVYECDTCGLRTIGEQRCEACGTFMRRIGLGGSCPSCSEPVAVVDLLDEEVITSR